MILVCLIKCEFRGLFWNLKVLASVSGEIVIFLNNIVEVSSSLIFTKDNYFNYSMISRYVLNSVTVMHYRYMFVPTHTHTLTHE